jgi:hypothetical protein
MSEFVGMTTFFKSDAGNKLGKLINTGNKAGNPPLNSKTGFNSKITDMPARKTELDNG